MVCITNKWKYISGLWSLLIINILNTSAQSYFSKNFTIDDGLPCSSIYHVLQDSKGYLWFGTNLGVSRYDGYNFTNYDLTDGLVDNTVFEIYEDYKGRIWFITLKGLLSYYENGKIHSYAFNNLIKENWENTNCPTKKHFYIDSLDGIHLSLIHKPMINITKDGNLLIPSKNLNTTSDVFRILPNGHVLSEFSNRLLNNNKLILEGDKSYNTKINIKYTIGYRPIVTKIDSIIYFIDNFTLFAIDYKNNNVKHFSFTNELIWISGDPNGIIWIGLYKGGVKGYTNHNLNHPVYELLPETSVSSVLKDKEGGTWFTTLNDGVFYFPSLKVAALTKTDGLNSNFISQISYHNNTIWFATENKHIYSYNFSQLKSHNLLTSKVGYFKCLKWLGDNLFVSYPPFMDNIFMLHDNKKTKIPSLFKGVIKRKNNSLILFSTVLINFIGDSIFKEHPGLKHHRHYYDVCENKNGDLWIATEAGLFLYKKNKEYTSMVSTHPLLGHRISSLTLLNDSLWMGTKGAGLLCMTKDTLLHFTKSDGLSSNSIIKIKNNKNNLWIATSNGIIKMSLNKNKGKYKIEKWSKANGLTSNEVNDIEITNDKVCVATNKGLCFFDKHLQGTNNYPPPIYIDKVRVNDNDTLNTDYLELEYYQNQLSFSYTGISFQKEEPLKYLYKLEGLEKKWKVTTEQERQYSFLPPGNYTFKVKAINNSNISSEKPQVFSFKIKTPYWKTTWFILLTVCLGIGMAVFIIILIQHNRIKSIKHKAHIESELNKFRQRALSAQMNPHFLFNSLNSAQNFILKKDPVTSSNYISKLGDLMRIILNNSQYDTITLQEELSALFLYIDLELIRFRNSFLFLHQISEDLDTTQIKLPPLIIQPFVENAIHHGLRLKDGEKCLKIKIYSKEEFVFVIVEDNGIGRKKSLEIQRSKQRKPTYQSLGTKITNKRLILFEQIHKHDLNLSIDDLTNKNGHAAGTRVTLKIRNKS